MSKRLEAAVKAWDHHWGDRYGDEAIEEMGEEVRVAINAADEVMFSDDAVDRVEAKLGDFFNNAFPLHSTVGDPRWTRPELRLAMRHVIAALKETADPDLLTEAPEAGPHEG